MLILKYFVVVGVVLMAGLIALNAHLVQSSPASSGAAVRTATAATLPAVAPKAQPVEEQPIADFIGPPAPPPKSAAPTRRSTQTARQHQPRPARPACSGWQWSC